MATPPPSFTPAQQELNNRAMLSIMKYLMSGAKVDGQLQTKFVNASKVSLNIDNETFKRVLAEVKALKAGGEMQGIPAGPPQGYGAGAGIQRQPSMQLSGAGTAKGGLKGRGSVTASVAPGYGMPPQPPQQQQRMAGGGAAAQKKSGMRKSGGGSPLPYNVGFRVNRYWPEEQAWYEAVITDYVAENNTHVLTYSFGSANESFEEVDLDAIDQEHCKIRFDQPRLNLLQHTKSQAVQNSTVMKPFLQDQAARRKRRSDGDGDDDYP